MEALASAQGARYVEYSDQTVQEIRPFEGGTDSHALVPLEPDRVPGHDLAYDKGGTDLAFQRAVLYTGVTGNGGIIDLYV